MLGIADCGIAAGFNVIRLNQRNCGDTDALTPTLYNSGRSGDFLAVLNELIEDDLLPAILFAGYSMGGNLVLKMAGELADHAPPQLFGVCGVCPTLELAQCVDACDTSWNPLYRWHFVSSLKGRMRRKAKLFPGLYNLNGLGQVKTLREFDDLITAPNCGYQDAVDYYHRASCLRVVEQIRVPTLLLTAKDDPVVPIAPFLDSIVTGNSNIKVVAPDHGGHCSFISADRTERRWAEPRVVEFFQETLERKHTSLLASQATG
jgi:predicted alpha/beta-fold hydrolase